MYCTVPLKPLVTVAVGGRVATTEGAIVAARDASRPCGRAAVVRAASPKSSSLTSGARRRSVTTHQHDVARLQIAMDDAGAMGAVERVADLDGQRQRVIDGKARRSVQPIRERLAFEMLEDQVVELAVAADVVDRADVRVVQRGDRPRLVLEAQPRFRVGRERAGQHLDGDRAIEPGVARAVDLAHSARAERGDDFVGTETGARVERHGNGAL